MSELATIQPTQEFSLDDDGSRELREASDVLTDKDFHELSMKAMQLGVYSDVVRGLDLAVEHGDADRLQELIDRKGPALFLEALMAEDPKTFQDVHDKLEPAIQHGKTVHTMEGAYSVEVVMPGYGAEQEVVSEAENALLSGGLQIIAHDHADVFDSFLQSGDFNDLRTSVREIFVNACDGLPELQHARDAIARELNDTIALMKSSLGDGEQLSEADVQQALETILSNRQAYPLYNLSIDTLQDMKRSASGEHHDLAA